MIISICDIRHIMLRGAFYEVSKSGKETDYY